MPIGELFVKIMFFRYRVVRRDDMEESLAVLIRVNPNAPSALARGMLDLLNYL